MTLFALRRPRDERGVVAILVGLLAILMLVCAAYAVDIGMQINRKHQLNDTLDAAAQAGAYELPGSANDAEAAALKFALAHDPTESGSLEPNVDFWCVVASKTSGTAVDTSQIPSTCNPGTSPYTVNANYKSTGRQISCSAVLCAIPCVEPSPNSATPPIACNTIRVYQGRDVPFSFGAAGGLPKGSTGTVVSVACKGSCGTVAPNPMDVVVVADRTKSMSSGEVEDMVEGIQGMLKVMTPSQQYVALGAIGRTGTSTTGQTSNCTSGQSTYPSGSGTSGKWVSMSFSKDYVSDTGTLQTGSPLVKATNCLKSPQSDAAQGTALAAPMKAAARYLLGKDPNNLSSLPTRDDPVTKVIIFETDGQPNEEMATTGTTSLDDSGDVFSNKERYTTGPQVTTGPTTGNVVENTNTRRVNRTDYTDTYYSTPLVTTKTTTRTLNGGQTACANFVDVAAKAKAANILVITIAYNLEGNVTCGSSNEANNVADDVDYGTPVITNITPSAARDTSSGKLTLKTSYAGNAKIYQTVAATVTRVTSVNGPDSVVRNSLAAAASSANGLPSVSNNSCTTDAERATENADGDYFFCAASGQTMAPIFTTALSQVSKGIKLLRLP